MIFDHSDARRGLRSIIQAIVVLAMILTVWFNIERLDAAGTRYILGWCMIILLVGTLGYIMENGLRSFDFEGWGFKGRASNSDEATGAKKVADAAKDKAEQIEEQAS